jgi:hypothetical protein
MSALRYMLGNTGSLLTVLTDVSRTRTPMSILTLRVVNCGISLSLVSCDAELRTVNF